MVYFKQAQLANGLDVIAEIIPDAQSSAIGFMVKTGSRDESPEVNGVSHFLEHMMFKGTSRRTAAQVNREFDAMGARNNAFTSNEVTCYWAHVLPEFLPAALDLLADMMRPALRNDDFDMEKKVILEEIALYLDRPGHVLYEAIMQDHFGRHPMAQSILGPKESISALTRDQMQAYFESHYGPGNMALAVAGKIDFDAFLSDVEKTCAAWPHVNVRRNYSTPELKANRRHITDVKLRRHYMAMICPGPSAQDDRRYAAQILSDVMGDSDGSRFYWSLVEPGLADDADFSFFPHDGMGSFFAGASCDPSRAAQVEEIMLAEISKAVAGGVSDSEVIRSRTKIETGAVLQGELPLGRMRNILGRWIYNHEYRTLEQELEVLRKTGAAEVTSLLRDYLLSPLTITTLGPG